MLSNKYCEKVINEFCSNTEEHLSYDRKYKRYILFEKDKHTHLWLWEHIDKLIKINLGPDYRLSTWIIGLRYDKGDYFKEHQDSTNKDRLLSGGIELSDKAYYKGGEYQLEGKSVISKRGELFTHHPKALHEITEVTEGTRYSLHFCISGKKELL
jgi:hypothetical protein